MFFIFFFCFHCFFSTAYAEILATLMCYDLIAVREVVYLDDPNSYSGGRFSPGRGHPPLRVETKRKVTPVPPIRVRLGAKKTFVTKMSTRDYKHGRDLLEEDL